MNTEKKNYKMKALLLASILFLALFVMAAPGLAQQNTVCCERTTTGAFCQDVPADECASDAQQVPTSCESTSFCKPGTCFDSSEGTCLDNTPQLVCNENGGIWSETSPPQCELGCCILGDQAAFVTLVRCKALSAQLGLETNYDSSIDSELSCIAAVQNQDQGACVYPIIEEGTNGCEFTTRSECTSKQNEGVTTEFYKDTLCTDPNLGTNCGPTTQTTCVDGKDEVYFVDTCGNPANIYDASRVNDNAYWSEVVSKAESCGPNSANAGDASCGNCNYLQGSFCRNEDDADANPTYGEFICADLNCYDTTNGQNYKHGESWCVYNDQGTFGESKNSVGSRFFKHICINGEEVLESCADYRNEECIADTTNGFSQAACKVNRWQDCTLQPSQDDCENTDRRDCLWHPDVSFGNATDGACLPQNPPGLNFWDSPETESICAQANTLCQVTFEKGLFGGESCISNCECLTESWEQERIDVCHGLGDCGPAVNWVGQEGYSEGYTVDIGSSNPLL